MTLATIPASVHDRCMNNIAALIKALNIQGQSNVTGDIGQNVFTQTFEEELALVFPCVVVSTVGQTEEETQDSFETNMVFYPVKLSIVDQMATNYQQRRPVYLYWRRLIKRYLYGLVDMPILPDAPECFNLDVHYLPVLEPKAASGQFVSMDLLVLCWTSEAAQRDD